MSPCLSWKMVPGLMDLESIVSQMRAQDWLPHSSRSF